MNNTTLKNTPFISLVLALLVAVTIIVTNLIGLTTTHAAEFKTGMITVKEPWARGTPRSGGAFMMIHNMGAADELVGAKADISKKVQIHRTVNENGVMKMKHVHGVPVPAKGMATLKPGSYHVMFMGLNKPMIAGYSFPLTLVFKNAGELNVMVEVKKLGGGIKMDHKMDQKKKS